jgi:hypothetical protein
LDDLQRALTCDLANPARGLNRELFIVMGELRIANGKRLILIAIHLHCLKLDLKSQALLRILWAAVTIHGFAFLRLK